MTLYEKREKSKPLQKISEYIGRLFVPFGLTPNQWTVLTLVPLAIAMWYVANGQFIFGAVFFLVAGFVDMIDGAVARATNNVTKKGAYLDTVLDRYVEVLVALPLTLVQFPSFILPFTFWLFAYLSGGLLTTYVKAAAKEKEIIKDGELKGGLLERAERLGLFVAGLVVAQFNILYFVYIVALLAVLTNISALQRISIALSKATQ